VELFEYHASEGRLYLPDPSAGSVVSRCNATRPKPAKGVHGRAIIPYLGHILPLLPHELVRAVHRPQ
jgi:hypothetical protein